MNRMSINQAARWAERKDCLYISGNTQNPMYAVVDQNDNRVDCLGAFEKCEAFISANRGWWRLYVLDEVLEQIRSDDAEAACYLGEREENVAWEAC